MTRPLKRPLTPRVRAIRTTILTTLGVALLFVASAGTAQAQASEPPSEDSTSAEPRPERRPVLFYIPNRIFDALDILRLRVRIGPGVAVGARATELVDAEIGAYTSIFVGVPGPRGRPRANLPLGVETFTGIEVSVVGGDSENSADGPNYGALEIGAGFQAALVGLEFGIDPGEMMDFVTSLLFIDLAGDDL